MAARARPSSRPMLAAVLVAVTLLAGSCSSHDTESEEARPATTGPPRAPADPRLVEIAGEVGCAATTPVDRRDGFTGAAICTVGGRTSTRIQTFPPSDRPSVEQRFSAAMGDAPDGGVECDGHTYEFAVLGDDWLVATSDRSVAGRLVVRLGAELVGSDGEAPRDRDRPDVCRNG